MITNYLKTQIEILPENAIEEVYLKHFFEINQAVYGSKNSLINLIYSDDGQDVALVIGKIK
ncbi:MAG: hypothetical protein UW68_C0046G0004 [Candidatus Collierbacteria bacterium GW2011_GWB1_44_6]|uniref:Uncharacterized protein n=1 Tax=Candidatus Collierbacteria bacterium GW2011_GWB1_44_6 TaxID=1618384 RepID=A0A0G1JKU3_9BACT|nr:MAG: hypothetical protein UW68_C0046G0004 [Candidatus Collierbacteria bacterium GW2011_GWB1_44_6]